MQPQVKRSWLDSHSWLASTLLELVRRRWQEPVPTAWVNTRVLLKSKCWRLRELQLPQLVLHILEEQHNWQPVLLAL